MPRFFTTKQHIGTLSEVNVIPLVDIVFTLLIIFMIIAPMIHKGIEVQVPDSSVGAMMPEHDYHIVSITSEGELWFDNQIVTFETLQEYLQPLSQEETLYIQSDKQVPYGQVVDVLTYIKEHGIQRVGLVTTPETKSSQKADTQ
jgi:biopolymer transport protein TolR